MPSILGGIETRDKNNRKLYNIQDNSLKTCTFIFKGKIHTRMVERLVSDFSNNSKTIFYFIFKENIDKNDFLDVINLMNFSFNDFYIFLYEKNQLQFLNELNCFVKHIIYFSDEHLLSCLAKVSSETIFLFLRKKSTPLFIVHLMSQFLASFMTFLSF